jgi:hypothetical protein
MMSLVRALVTLVVYFAVALVPVVAAQPQPPAQQGEFVPIDQLPPQDQLPAAPLLVAAYIFVLVAFVVYVLSVSKRLTAVQREVERLERDLKRPGPA